MLFSLACTENLTETNAFNQKVNSFFVFVWLDFLGISHVPLVQYSPNCLCLCALFPLQNSSLALDPAEEYKMDNKRRGLALIFNQERFFWRLGLNNRHGTNADRYNLEKRYHFPASCWRGNTGSVKLCDRELVCTCSVTVTLFGG